MKATFDEAGWKAVEQIAVFVEKRAEAYPVDVFPDDSKSPDGIAARALRHMLPRLAQEIREGLWVE